MWYYILLKHTKLLNHNHLEYNIFRKFLQKF
nr:MAG TPA: hypothetical protein [Bacteriophage sp.]